MFRKFLTRFTRRGRRCCLFRLLEPIPEAYRQPAQHSHTICQSAFNGNNFNRFAPFFLLCFLQPRLADTRRSAIHCADMDIEYYRLRSFSITSHGICNLGDSMRLDIFLEFRFWAFQLILILGFQKSSVPIDQLGHVYRIRRWWRDQGPEGKQWIAEAGRFDGSFWGWKPRQPGCREGEDPGLQGGHAGSLRSWKNGSDLPVYDFRVHLRVRFEFG